MRFTTREIAEVVGGDAIGGDATVDGATQDSREVQPGHLFVPVAAQVDGHDFVVDAVAAGATAHLTAQTRTVDHGPAVVVDDTVAALGRLGAAGRARVSGPVVGITGSVGKTTTKDLLAALLRPRYATAAAQRSFNNEIGVPLTILGAPPATEALVLEMGARGVGHIAELCVIGRPTVGVVTEVAMVHTELFGDLDTVARAKGELVESLPPDGLAVLNADNPRVAAMAERSGAPVIWFGHDGDVRAEAVVVGDDLRAAFTLVTPWGDAPVRLGIRGRHNVANALAAVAAAGSLGVELDDLVVALEAAEGSPWRMDLRTAPSGALILNDSYNAGPASMAAALAALATLPASRRVAVLGPMAELGTAADSAHRRIAELAHASEIEVIAVGTGHYGAAAVEVPDAASALGRLGDLGEGDAVLVKGSRIAGLERVAHALLAPGG